jgi:hypothetical protein
MLAMILAAVLGAAPVPHVPAPPLPPPSRGVFGQKQHLQDVRDQREAYRQEIEAFLKGLTPEQAKALVLDETEIEHLVLARAFIKGIDLNASRDATAATAIAPRMRSPDSAGDGTPVYSRSECIGPVIGGVCQGALAPNGGYHETCHGQMLNGSCTGPMF